MTCDFWAENVKIKIEAAAKTIESVAYAVGIHHPRLRLFRKRRPLRSRLDGPNNGAGTCAAWTTHLRDRNH